MTTRQLREELVEYFDELGDDGRFLLGPALALRWGVLEVKTFLGTMGGLQAARREFLGDGLMAEVAEAAENVGMGKEKAQMLKGKGAHVTKVRYRLNDVSRLYIRDMMAQNTFVEFLEAGSSDYNPHPILRALKDITDNVLWSTICKHEVVTEVGPNVVGAVMRGPRPHFYHGLNPTFDSLDIERSTTGRKVLQLKLEQQKKLGLKPAQVAALKDFKSWPNSVMFERTALQHFEKKTDVIYAMDSVYDIDLKDLVYAMHRTGARLTLGSMVNVPTLPDVLTGAASPEGRIGQTEQIWKAVPERDEVLFLFRNAGNRPYVHKLSRLVEYYKFATREFEIDGQLYHFRHLPLTNEVILAFDIQRVPRDRHFVADPLPSYRFNGREEEVVINTYSVDMQYAKGDSRRVTPFKLFVGKDSFSRILSDRLLRGPGKLESTINYIRTNRVSIVHNGVRVSCANPVSADYVGSFATAVDALAVQLEKSAEQDYEFIEKTMHNGGWCTPATTHAKDPSMVRVLWNRILTDSAEAEPVSVCDAKEVLITENERVVLDGGAAYTEPTACDQIREAVDALSGACGPINDEEREALECWLVMMKGKGCHCDKCEAEKAEAEEAGSQTSEDDIAQEEWFDSAEERTDESEQESQTGPIVLPKLDDGSGTFEPVKKPVTIDVNDHEGTSTVFLDSLVPQVTTVPRIVVTEGFARDAVVEFVEIMKMQMEAAESSCRQIADRLMRGDGFTATSLAALSNETCKHYAYRIGKAHTVDLRIGNSPAPTAVSHLYDPVHRIFRDVSVIQGNTFVSNYASEILYSNSDLDVWLNPKIIANLTQVLSDPFFGQVGEPIPIVNGIWGSGKTFLAKQWFKDEWKVGRRTMFLGVSKTPTESVREQLFGEDPEGKTWVRTIGSALFNGVTDKVTNLIIDEVCMTHAAVVYALRHILKPEKMWVCGDAMQMPYVPFVSGFKPKKHTFYHNARMVLLQKGHRVPLDVYAGGLDIYGKDSGIHPCSCHKRSQTSLKHELIASLANIPVERNCTYLTHTQSTKDKLKSRLGSKGLDENDVHTMAEFQGDSAQKVIVVRDVPAYKKGSIYFERLRANVGVSRSTGDTLYLSTSREEDYMVHFIKQAKLQSNQDIIRENIRKYQDTPAFSTDDLNAFLAGTLPADNVALQAGEQLRKRIVFGSSIKID